MFKNKVSNKKNKVNVNNTKNKKHLDIKLLFNNFLAFLKRYWKILLAIFAIILLLIISIFIYNRYYEKKYGAYEVKMHTYGFDKMYDNKEALSYEKVTKSEAIKMIIASIYNIYDINEIYYEQDTSYPNAMWVDYAVSQGIINKDEINSKNQNSNISYLDVIKYYLDARNKLLDKQLKSDSQAKFSDIKKYTSDMQVYINDAVENKLIDNTNKKLNAKKSIIKGQMNQLITNFVEHYNTITLSGDKININPDKQPNNYNIYPYILSNVDKLVYQKELLKDEAYGYIDPITTYIMEKEYYPQIKENCEGYFNTLLNVDYNTISLDNLKENINKYVMYGYSDDDLQSYIDYVKLHKIKTTGTAKVQMPIVYFDGNFYRVRMKISLKIESGDTKDNLFIEDSLLSKTYTYSDSDEIIIDAKLGHVYNQNYLYIYPTSISNLIIK